MKISTTVAGFWSYLIKSTWRDPTSFPKSISDHAARDIGMTKVELERHRFVWPSETKDRPLL